MIHDTPANRVFARTIVLAVALLAGCATPPAAPDIATLQQQVTATERAFARTMQDRDHAAFVSFLAEDTVFFAGSQPLRGRTAVAAAWKRYYEQPTAPFSWAPAEVEVLDSGTLAISSGPVHNAEGKLIATFTSIWRQEAPGVWRIVFDKGKEACACAAPR